MLLFSSCSHTVLVDDCVEGLQVYGFWNGLWHGMIAPFTFIGHLFNRDIAVFAISNNGPWYVFGFLMGIGLFIGGVRKIK